MKDTSIVFQNVQNINQRYELLHQQGTSDDALNGLRTSCIKPLPSSLRRSRSS